MFQLFHVSRLAYPRACITRFARARTSKWQRRRVVFRKRVVQGALNACFEVKVLAGQLARATESRLYLSIRDTDELEISPIFVNIGEYRLFDTRPPVVQMQTSPPGYPHR